MSAPAAPLSPAGRARRAAIKRELLQAFERHHLGRRRRRRAALALGAVLVAGLWYRGLAGRPERRQRPAAGPRLEIVETRAGRGRHLVETRRDWRDRLVETRPLAPALLLDDDELLDLLAALGRPAGLVRCGRRVLLAGLGTASN